jgi:hypothetical protein
MRRSVLLVPAVAIVFAAAGAASSSDDLKLSPVPTANTKAAGYAPASRLSAELQQVALAQGSTSLENPQGIITHYGYENDVPSADDATLPQMLPTPTSPTEAVKTEPDKNTYLVFRHGLHGPDSAYDYGTHFLYQGHEGAATVSGKRQGYITRINLDADAQHRVTLLASQEVNGVPLSTIDGSTWDPWARRLLITTENQNAPTYSATPDFPSTVEDVSGALGRGGYEGIQNDSEANIWIVEDIGGVVKPGSTAARMPNSFIYRYVPAHPGDLHNGKLQALQVLNEAGQPITFESEATFPSPDQIALHTFGKVFDTRWVTVHDTAVDGNASFNANLAAKAAHATPFKRPENGQFRPGTHFTEFYFDETGDTNATSSENGDPATGAGGAGGWGSIMKLVQRDPSADTGKLSLFYRNNEAHSGFDNVTFLSRNLVTFVEDAGDTLHTQRKALDSGYVFDVTTDYSDSSNQPSRWLAQGRDASATIDSANGGFGKNDGDNEITGAHVSDGDPSANGILGAKVPHLFEDGWRWFYTQQHGDNPTYEVEPSNGNPRDDE